MITKKEGLLIRVRTVLTVMVVLAGLGSTLMAMKPAEKSADYKYGVSETAGGMHYLIEKNVTSDPESSWDCNNGRTACTVFSNTPAPVDSLILKSQASVIQLGDFVPQ